MIKNNNSRFEILCMVVGDLLVKEEEKTITKKLLSTGINKKFSFKDIAMYSQEGTHETYSQFCKPVVVKGVTVYYTV